MGRVRSGRVYHLIGAGSEARSFLEPLAACIIKGSAVVPSCGKYGRDSSAGASEEKWMRVGEVKEIQRRPRPVRSGPVQSG